MSDAAGHGTPVRRFLVLLGPSGAGKSTQMMALPTIDSRFVRISAYTTRPLRAGEAEKITIDPEEFERMASEGHFATVNDNYGHRYGTPRLAVEAALATGQFPVMDFPWRRLDVLRESFKGEIYAMFLEPPSLRVLASRLRGRADAEARVREASEELALLRRVGAGPAIDSRVIVTEGDVEGVSRRIRALFLDQAESSPTNDVHPT